jgi:Cof subfamily protein (haloacid dehalogenase superfamily)
VKPTLVACDLDGTLLRSDGTLDDRSLSAIATVRAAGATLVICTARPSRWLRPFAAAVGPGAVAICANGGVVWDLDADALLHASPLLPEDARAVVGRLTAALPGGAWAVERVGGFAREPGYVSHWPVPEGTAVQNVEALLAEPAVKLMLRHEQFLADALLERARAVVGDLAQLSHSNSADCLLEISAAGVSKASALSAFCERRRIGRERVIAFGDMPNDLPMLRWAGHGVAVANAHAEVLDAADEVTTSNDEAGVARVLERIFSTVAIGAEMQRGGGELRGGLR